MTKTLKSAVAVIVSGSLIVTTAVMPVAAQTFRAGQSAEAGSAARASFTPSTLNGVQTLPSAILGSANLVPALSPAVVPTALALPLPAAAKADEGPGAQQPVKETGAPLSPAKPEAGPRWVKTEPKPVQAPARAEGGPRWVGPQKSGLRTALSKYLPFLGRSGAEAFDGAAAREDGVADAPVAAKGE
ncbi:MAG: hypothetical protein PHS14_17030, partial [Elusimicrobia bacterium]|nr:hypothetical protein [Elusimicrobiota bacterium]